MSKFIKCCDMILSKQGNFHNCEICGANYRFTHYLLVSSRSLPVLCTKPIHQHSFSHTMYFVNAVIDGKVLRECIIPSNVFESELEALNMKMEALENESYIVNQRLEEIENV